jgi:hypothetical protein
VPNRDYGSAQSPMISILRIVYHLSIRTAAAVVGFFLLGYQRVEYYAFRLLGLHRPEVHHGAVRVDGGCWCIFAAWQTRALSGNLLTGLNILRDAGYNIVLVNDGRLDAALVAALVPLCHTILLKRGGRDFGSYKCGTLFLLQQQEQHPRDLRLRQVVYCNDSTFFLESAFSRLISELRTCDADYVGAIENFEIHYHVASWFFIVSDNVFNLRSFRDFWFEYKPISNRAHAINNGEVSLSRVLLKEGISPKILFTGKMAVDACFSGELGAVMDRFSKLAGTRLWERVQRALGQIPPVGDVEPYLRRIVYDETAVYNNMNLLNLLLISLCGLPFLKKDLVFRDQAFVWQIEHLVESWTGKDRDHVPEILGFFRSRDAVRWARGLRGFLMRQGLV